MGCISSKKELRDINPNMYRVVNVDEAGTPLCAGQLAITRTELTFYSKNKEPTQWPLKCLRRYGYDTDMFTFEAGRRCTTGEGIYAFRCRRAQGLFQTLQGYIQLPLQPDGSENPMDGFAAGYPVPIVTNGPAVTPRNRGSILLVASQPDGYVLTNRPISQSISPSGMTVLSNPMRTHSTDTLTGTADGNYLEPTPTTGRPLASLSRFNSGLRLGSMGGSVLLGPLSPDPHSPGSPSSITNILEVTTLNPLPASSPGISNLYQEFPLREHNNNDSLLSNSNNSHQIVSHKKLSLDIPPQEPAPSLNLTSLRAQSAVISNFNNNNNEFSSGQFHQPMSPATASGMTASDSFDSAHMYMNITPGEMNASKSFTGHTNSAAASIGSGSGGGDTPQIVQTPTTSTISMFGMSRMNSTFSIDPNRLYENLETGEMRPLLTGVAGRNNRFSKPDIFSKVDLPSTGGSSSDKSDPCTPTIHYIVLDLDQSPANMANSVTGNNSLTTQISLTMPNNLAAAAAASNVSSGSPTNGPLMNYGGVTPLSSATTPPTTAATTSMIPMSLLPPESPKKGVMDYATIDFNKTVALSNSTTPSSDLDAEGSRKTRHSSVAAPPPLTNNMTTTTNITSD